MSSSILCYQYGGASVSCNVRVPFPAQGALLPRCSKAIRKAHFSVDYVDTLHQVDVNSPVIHICLQLTIEGGMQLSTEDMSSHHALCTFQGLRNKSAVGMGGPLFDLLDRRFTFLLTAL